MKKTALFVSIALVGALALTGCASKGGEKTSSTSGEKIIIGSALCQTGIQAPLDEPALRGAQLAVDELNANGGILGKQVELVAMDGKSDPVTVGNVAKQLIEQGAVRDHRPERLRLRWPGVPRGAVGRYRRHLAVRFVAALRLGSARRQAVHAVHVEHHHGRRDR